MFTEIFNFTFYVMLQVTLFTMAGLAIMPFYVNRFKSEICFFVKKSGIFFLGHIAQPYRVDGAWKTC